MAEKSKDKPTAIAQSIIHIGDSLRELQERGLNRSAVVALVHDSTGVEKRIIDAVLTGLAALGRLYTP